jgi:hypothetical protein
VAASAAVLIPLIEQLEPVAQAGIIALIRAIKNHKHPVKAIQSAQVAVERTEGFVDTTSLYGG